MAFCHINLPSAISSSCFSTVAVKPVSTIDLKYLTKKSVVTSAKCVGSNLFLSPPKLSVCSFLVILLSAKL